METPQTTIDIQTYLDRLGGAKGEEPLNEVVQALLARSFDRLSMLCGCMLHQSYERLTQPPLNLRTEELLSSVVERLLKAMTSVRPGSVRQFFAMVNQHMRWELNDLARRLDEQTRAVALRA